MTGSTSEGAVFLTTRWSLVAAAGAAESERAREALASLCQSYWFPLYAFVRRRGASAADAEDIVQGFFSRLIETRDLAKFVRGEARFRSFLRTAIANHMSNVRDRESAEKRGGGRVRLAVDLAQAERRLAAEVADGVDPAAEFDRLWAQDLLSASLESLREDYAARGDAASFDALRPFLQAGDHPPEIGGIAKILDRSEVAVRVALHRLRGRFRERLEAEIAGTLDDPAEIEEERARLIDALSRNFGKGQ